MSEIRKTNQDPAEYLQFLNEEANKKECQIKELDTKYTECVNKVSDIEALLISKQEEYDKVSAEIEKKIEDKRAEIEVILSQIESLKLEQQEYDKVLDTLKGLVIHDQNITKKLEEDKDTLTSSINALSTRYNELQHNHTSLSNENNNLIISISEKNTEIAKIDEQIQEAKSRLTSTEDKIQENIAAAKLELEQLNIKKAEIERLKVEVDQKAASVATFDKERATYIEDMSAKLREIEIKEKETNEREEDSQRRAAELSAREKEYLIKEQELDLRERMVAIKVKQYKLDKNE